MDPLLFIILLIPIAGATPVVAYRLAWGKWPF